MSQIKINKKDIENYILPKLEALRALFKNLHLYKSLKTLSFLEQMVESEISKQKRAGTNNSVPKAQNNQS